MNRESALENRRATTTHDVDAGGRRDGGTVLVVATVIGLLWGPLDLAGQVHAPYPFANLFNSPAVWAAVAFAVGRWVGRPASAAAGAVLSVAVGVESYYAADVVFRGANTSTMWSRVAVVWLVLAVGAGVVFGTAGALSTRFATWTAAVSSAVLPAVLLAEAAHEATTSREADWMALLVVVAAGTTWWLLRHSGHTGVTRTSLCLTGLTVLGFIAYLPFG